MIGIGEKQAYSHLARVLPVSEISYLATIRHSEKNVYGIHKNENRNSIPRTQCQNSGSGKSAENVQNDR